MSFYNGVLNYSATSATGQRGLPGIGFKLDGNNNYDIQNKKLVNVGEELIPTMLSQRVKYNCWIIHRVMYKLIKR